MKILYTLFLLVTFSLNVFGQTHKYRPFPDSNAVWTEVVKPFPMDSPSKFYLNKYSITGDTVIKGLTYKKLGKIVYRYRGKYLSSYCCSQFFRQDTSHKRVYIWYNNVDTLAYDFNLKSGDTLKNLFYCSYYNSSNAYIVRSVDSVLLHDGYHKRWKFGHTFVSNDTIGEWIEGIGNILGFFYRVDWVSGDQEAILTCLKRNGTTIFNNPANYKSGLRIADCDTLYISGIPEVYLPSNSITFYPNPAGYFATVKWQLPAFRGNAVLQVTSIDGKTVYSNAINSPSNEIAINTTNWANGIYFVTISDDKGKVASEKLSVIK